MHKVAAERPLDATTLEILRYLDGSFSRQDIGYFLLGATARDILMYHVFGIPTGRATRDVDFAIALETWTQFDQIKNLLLATGKFTPSADAVHRLHYVVDEGGQGYPVDLIPFGRIEDDASQIAWPPDQAILMNVTGYAEAMQIASVIEVDAGLAIKVVSLPGLAALKLLAWVDRGKRDPKDAQDLFFLLKNYTGAGNEARLYEHAMSLLEHCGFDPDLAGAALLGIDCRRAMAADTIRQIRTVLDDLSKRDRLVLHMGGRSEETAANALRYLDQFRYGLDLNEAGD
jgi:predicted nucleotidyltransferase